MTGHPSRRAFVGGLMAVPAAGLITAIPVTAAASASRAEWYGLKARYDAAKGEEDAYNRDVCDPTEAEFDARCGTPPLLWFDITARSGQTARYWVSPPDFETAPIPQFEREAVRIRAEWERYRALHALWHPRLNLDVIRERSTALGDLRYDLGKQLVQTPAPDHPALLWKIENLWGEQLEWGTSHTDSDPMEEVRPIIEDCRRLLGERLRP